MRRLLGTLFLFSLISQAKADCPSGSVASADGTRCFSFNSTLLPFQSAELNCQLRYNGHLASIQNGFDNNLLNNLNPSSPATAYWIGGIKIDSADTNFFWTDGSEVSYTQWAVGQPVSSKMCIAHELATNNWQTRDCGESLPYVCAGASNATVPSTQPPPVQDCRLKSGVFNPIKVASVKSDKASKCDDGWTMFAYPYYEQPGNCYKVLTNQPGCTAAFSACTALGANVASVHSEAENGFLLGLTVPTGTKAGDDQQTCIGLQHVKENDNYVNTFQWSDGTAGDYCNWHQGYPTFAANNNCAILYSSYTDGKLVGKWSDFPCETNERTVVCKKRAN